MSAAPPAGRPQALPECEWSADGWLTGARRVDSPNFGPRPLGENVSLVVIHNISLPPDEFGGDWIEHFFTNRLDPAAHPYFATIAEQKVSAHFLIRRDGEAVQFVSCDDRAWHAGASCWQGRENCNDYSVGIELEGCDNQAFTPAQYERLWRVLAALSRRYPITAAAGHEEVAPGRKTDPGPHFDWVNLRGRFPGWRA